MIRNLLALSVLLGVATAPAAVAAEPGAPPARAGLEVLRDLGGRVPLTGPKTAKPHPLPPVTPAPAPCASAQITPRRDLPPALRFPCGQHPPYLPTAPPVAG